MVARFFKNNDKLGFVLLPVAAVAAWSFSLMLPGFHHLRTENSILLSLFAGKLPFWSIKAANLIALITGAYLITFLCIKQEISDKQNLLPGFVYIIISGVLNNSSTLHPAIVANLFLIVSFHRLFSTYREELSLAAVFDSAFLLGLAVLVYTPASAFVLIPFIALMILKPFKLREWILVICGLVLPSVLTATLLFLFNVPLSPSFDAFISSFAPLHKFIFGKGSLLIHAVTGLLLFLGLLNSFIRSGNSKIKAQKIRNILVWFILFGGAVVFWANENPFLFGILLIVPASIFIGDFLGNLKSAVLREFLTLLLLAAFICSNLQAAGFL